MSSTHEGLAIAREVFGLPAAQETRTRPAQAPAHATIMRLVSAT